MNEPLVETDSNLESLRKRLHGKHPPVALVPVVATAAGERRLRIAVDQPDLGDRGGPFQPERQDRAGRVAGRAPAGLGDTVDHVGCHEGDRLAGEVDACGGV